MTHTPSQDDIDRVAVYVEATRELANEPFFEEDENRKISFQGTHFIYTLGDRFHFRSALVTFRRIWMSKEPSHFYSCHNVLARYGDTDERNLLNSWRQKVRQIEDEKATFPGKPVVQLPVPNSELIDLWLNAVFAHVSMRPPDNTRKQFEALLSSYGQAPLEYAFRLSVWQLGIQYQNMSRIHAERFLDHWDKTLGLKPSFTIGAPFGTKRVEVTAEGHTIIRKASSRYYASEPIEAMLQRICARHGNSNINLLLSHVEMPYVEVTKKLLSADSIRSLITSLDRELKIVSEADLAGEFPGEGPRSFGGLYVWGLRKGSKMIISSDLVITTEVGLEILAHAFSKLMAEFRKELSREP